MIRILSIINFQSHDKSVLSLTPGVNVIVGDSDSGKTAILRALNFVINNKPSGTSFIQHGKEECSVRIKTEEYEVSRFRGKNVNTYIARRHNEEPETYKAFGQDVPEKVKDILNISDINMQRQMDSPFMLSMSPVDTARMLNKIVNLDIIDTTFSNINKMMFQTNSRIKNITKSIGDTETELKKYENLDVLEKQLEFIMNMESEASSMEEKITGIQKNIDAFRETEKKLSSLKRIRNLSSKMEKVDALMKKRDLILGKLVPIKDMIRKHSVIQTDLSQIRGDGDRARKTYNEIAPDLCPLCGEGKMERMERI